MKRTIWIIILIPILFASCVSMTGSKETSYESNAETEFDIFSPEYILQLEETNLKLYPQAKLIAQEKVQELIERGFPLAVYKYSSGTPNSAGGVDVNIHYKNISSKDIKYIVFTLKPYNAVDDIVTCTISGRAEAKLKVTGPLYAMNMGDPDYSNWKNVWYNFSIKRIEIEKVEITYMDDSKESFLASQALEMFIDKDAIDRTVGIVTYKEVVDTFFENIYN